MSTPSPFRYTPDPRPAECLARYTPETTADPVEVLCQYQAGHDGPHGAIAADDWLTWDGDADPCPYCGSTSYRESDCLPTCAYRARHDACLFDHDAETAGRCECHRTMNVDLGYSCTCPTAETVAARARELARILERLEEALPTDHAGAHAHAAMLNLYVLADDLERYGQES